MDGDPTMTGPRGPLHDASGRFARGNPGRRKGSRNRMTNQLALGLLDDFASNEEANIERLRRWFFPQYVQLMTRFIPREADRPRPDFADYAPQETARVLAAARAALEAAEHGEAGLDALLEVLEQDPATLEPAPEGMAEDISSHVNYVESTLLAVALSAPTVDLDEIHWLPGGFNARREPAVAVDMVRTRAADDAWVIEGVFGWLANEALPRATALIWLDVPVEECIANVKARGQKSGGDAASFAALIEWVADYPDQRELPYRTRAGV